MASKKKKATPMLRPSLKGFYSREEVSEMFGVSVSTIDRQIKCRLLRPSYCHRRVLVSVDEVDRFKKEITPSLSYGC